MVQLLVLEHAADLHRINAAGDTPLITAAKSTSRSSTLMQFLVGCGADIYQPNAAGDSALRLCSASTPALAASPFAASSPFISTSTSATSELQQILLDTFNSPVRQFVVLQQRQLATLQQQLSTATTHLHLMDSLQAHAKSSDQQLQTCQHALQSGSTALRELDAELERTQQRQQAEINQTHTYLQHTQPRVLISEVRQALHVLKRAFSVEA
jgi:hypothetical protein